MTLPEIGTRHPSGCYFGAVSFSDNVSWVAIIGCKETHPWIVDSYHVLPTIWCHTVCKWCGYPENTPHSLQLIGTGCMMGAMGDILVALESPEDPGHAYRVARMLSVKNGMCCVLNCVRDACDTACVDHKDLHACDSCNFQTQQLIEGQCPGCYHLDRRNYA